MKLNHDLQIALPAPGAPCDVMEALRVRLSARAPNSFHSRRSGACRNAVEVKCFSSEGGLHRAAFPVAVQRPQEGENSEGGLMESRSGSHALKPRSRRRRRSGVAGGLKSLLYELGVAVPGARVGERHLPDHAGSEEHFSKNSAPTLVRKSVWSAYSAQNNVYYTQLQFGVHYQFNTYEMLKFAAAPVGVPCQS